MSKVRDVTSMAPEKVSKSNLVLFKDLKAFLKKKPDKVSFIEDYLVHHINEFNPSDHGKRFEFGRGYEDMIADSLKEAGHLDVKRAGHSQVGADLVSTDDPSINISVKSSASMNKHYKWSISNGINGSGCGMAAPTIFASPVLGGLLYADPNLHPEVAANIEERSADTKLSNKILVTHKAKNPSLFIPMSIPNSADVIPNKEEQLSLFEQFKIHQDQKDHSIAS